MKEADVTRLVHSIGKVEGEVSDLVVLLHEELTLTGTAQSFPFTGLEASDVKAIEIRVRKDGSPTDAGHIARFTMTNGDTPTSSHGMYLGDGDLYTITGNSNCINSKIIRTDSTSPVCNVVYYGY